MKDCSPDPLDSFKEGERISVDIIKSRCKLKHNKANSEFQRLVKEKRIIKLGNHFIVQNF